MEKGSGELEQVQFVGTRDRLGTATNPQLAVDVAGVFFDCVDGDDQLAGDLRVRITLAD